MPPARRCRPRRSRCAGAPMRFCWARSAAPSGPTRTPRCVPSRGCCSCARRSGCSRTCAPSCPTRRCSTPRRSRRSSCGASTSWWCASSPAASISATSSAPPPRRSTSAATASSEIERVVRVAAQLARGAAPQAHLRRQGERAGDLAALALGGRSHHAGRVLRCRATSTCWSIRPRCICIKRPRDFDVMVMENMFGDILTDEASMLAGSMGLLPSASLGAKGAADCSSPSTDPRPTSPGRGIANPYAAILSAALLLRYALELESEARSWKRRSHGAVDRGRRCPRISRLPARASVTTRAAGDAVLAAL